MNNLVDPHNSTPASGNQRRALGEAYRMLGGAPKERRGRPARSVHVDCLDSGGVDRGLLLWLLFQGHLHHFHGDKRRRASGVRAVASVVAGLTSSFTLTDAGRAFASRFLAPTRAGELIALPMGDLMPRYSALPTHRLLSWGAHTLKRFSQRLGNQEAILEVFEEQQWDPWLDDPLSGDGKVDPKKRLHNTIRDLNRWQNPYLIHFKAIGRGTAVGWELH